MSNLNKDIVRIKIESPYISSIAEPGQFINIKANVGFEPLLRRPISILNIDKINGTIDIAVQKKGIGTEIIFNKEVHSELDVIGPIGKPFHIDSKYKKVAIVGGGIGIFPLYALAKQYNYANITTYLGFRNNEAVVMETDFLSISNQLIIYTDDGSYGKKGYIIESLKIDLETDLPDIIFACGPLQMLKGVVKLAEKYNIPCQISMEQRMGCGIGACLVCACKTISDEGLGYSHVCKDGAVFWSDMIVLED